MVNNIEDEILVKRAQKGDVHAFEALLARHYDTIFKIAFKWCRNESDAQDITQDACVKLSRGLDGFKGESAFTSWLYRLVINAGKDWYKKQNRHPSNPDAMETVSVKNKSDEQLYVAKVLEAIDDLPEGEKDALLLVVSEGLSHKEAADVLKCKESTVSWRIHEARKKLNVHFDKEQNNG